MTSRIQTLDGWTLPRHLALAEAELFVFYPALLPSEKSRYARRDGTPATREESRTLKALRDNELIRHKMTTNVYGRHEVKRTDVGGEVLNLWTKHKGSPVEPVLSAEALKHAGEFADFLEWHGRQARPSWGTPVIGAAGMLRKLTDTDGENTK